jgi:cyanophycinase-like exopeptidase
MVVCPRFHRPKQLVCLALVEGAEAKIVGAGSVDVVEAEEQPSIARMAALARQQWIVGVSELSRSASSEHESG